MAAVALLAVGVGVWSIPRTVEFESDEGTAAPKMKETAKLEEAVAAAPESERSVGADFEDARGLEARATEDPAGSAGLAAADRAAPAERAAPPKAGNQASARKASRAKRQRAAAPKSAPVEADVAEAEEMTAPAAAPSVVAKESPVAARRMARGDTDGRAEAYGGAAAESEPTAKGAAMKVAASDAADDETREQAVCKSKVAAFEKRLRNEKRYEPKPEEELAMGRCYQTLGDAKNARTWLERAAKHRATRKRANEALQRLGSE